MTEIADNIEITVTNDDSLMVIKLPFSLHITIPLITNQVIVEIRLMQIRYLARGLITFRLVCFDTDIAHMTLLLCEVGTQNETV